MKEGFKPTRALAACAALLCIVANTSASAAATRPNSLQTAAQQPVQPKTPQAPEAELKEAQKVEAGVDAAARLQAAGEFIKKYPKSTLRQQVAQVVLQKLVDVKDDAQQIAFSENFMAAFNEPAESDLIQPFAIDAYVRAKRYADAFRVAAAYLGRNPEAVGVLSQMAFTGIDQARNNNPQFVEVSRQYGRKAVELIEADKKPAGFDDALWSQYKTRQLPQLHQYLAVLAYMSKNSAEAVAGLEKAAALNPADAFNYLLMSDIYNAEYERMAQEHAAAPAGPAKEELLKKSQAQMDKVIDSYAHALALSEGDERFKQAREQIMTALQTYFKYRHNGSIDGLQQLIDKYKTPVSTPKP